MKTPFDPAIAVTKFVLALTRGSSNETWKREHGIAATRLQTLESDAARWTASHPPVGEPPHV